MAKRPDFSRFTTGARLPALLGRAVDYMEPGFTEWPAQAVDNLDRIFAVAIEMLGEVVSQAGQIAPQVLGAALEAGRFCEDAVTARYLGGILASSRSAAPRDNRGVAVLTLVTRLSTYEIRSHYVCYHMVKRVFDGTRLKLSSPADRSEARVHIALERSIASMGLDEAERPHFGALVRHIVGGLGREMLVEGCQAFGYPESWDPTWRPSEPAGIEFQPSPLGLELFFWVHGLPNHPINAFLDPALTFRVFPEITIAPGYDRPLI